MYKIFSSGSGGALRCHLPKLIRVMKLTALLLFIFIIQLKAEGLAQTVTVKADKTPFKELIVKLHRSTGYNFIYNTELIKAVPPVSVNFKEAPLQVVFTKIFTNNGLDYVINKDDGTVVLSKKVVTMPTAAPPVQIKGTVTDEKGEALPGAIIRVKGSNAAASTNLQGAFIILAPDDNKTLVVSLLGFETQEVTVGSGNTIAVVLKAKDSRLDEVLVIGYGTQKRSDVTTAMSSLQSAAIAERGVTRIDQALVGQVAGVTVKQTTGLPGKGFSVQIRGSGSISAGNEPLYVIDGFPLGQSSQDGVGGFSGGNALDNLNPDDIESMEILKDAAAAAIYGSRGSNGVVIITTKKGKVGKAKIQFNSSAGYSEAVRKVDMLSGEEWIDRAKEIITAAYVNAYGARGATANDDIARRISIVGSNNVAYVPDARWYMPGYPGLKFVDWQDEIFRKGVLQNHQVSASGGTNNVNYFVSANNIRQQGIVVGTDNTQYSVRANIEANLNQKLKVGVNINPSYSKLNDPGVEGKDVIYHQSLFLPPVVEDTAGVYTNAFKNNQYNYAVALNSPVAKAENQLGETKRNRIIASVYGIYTLLKGLTFKTSLNVDNSNIAFRRYTPYTVTNLLSVRNAQTTVNTSGGYQTTNNQAFVNENTLNYSTTLAKNHSLNLLLGQSYNYFYSENSVMNSVGGYNNATIQTLNAALGISGRTTAAKNTLVSFFSRAQYSFKNRYLISGSIRTDGSSRFGDNNKYGVFPAGSIGWRVIEESFMKKLPVFSDLKLRATYGVTGNNSIPDFRAIPTIGSYGYVLGTGQAIAIGQAPNRIANPDLKWEKNRTVDFGFDFGLFKNRITGSFDYYNRLTSDLLLNASTLWVTGFNVYLSNTGSVRNQGWEVELATKNLTGKFQWNTNLQFTHNKNKVVSLANGQKQILMPSLYTGVQNSILRVGEALNSIYVVKQVGILSQEDINNKAARFGNQAVGDPKFEDFDNNGVIDGNDRQIVGHPNPDYTWGITNTFSYKGFDLRVFVQGQLGGSIYSILGRAVSQTSLGYTYNQLGDARDRWRSPSDPGAGLRGKAYSTLSNLVNTDWLYSSDYFRVRNITLGYNLKNVLKVKAVSTARVFVSADNFFGRDKYYGGANPESANTDLSGNGNYPQSGDYGGLPLAKTLLFGLNFSF